MSSVPSSPLCMCLSVCHQLSQDSHLHFQENFTQLFIPVWRRVGLSLYKPKRINSRPPSSETASTLIVRPHADPANTRLGRNALTTCVIFAFSMPCHRTELFIHQDQTMRSGVGLCVLALLCLHSSVFGQVRSTRVSVSSSNHNFWLIFWN